MDVSSRMVELARIRTAGRAQVHQADLSSSLEFLSAATFDLVLSPLVLEYIRDWRRTFREFHRLLSPGGRIVVSVTHPFSDFMYFESERYFETELVAAEWSGFGQPQRGFRMRITERSPSPYSFHRRRRVHPHRAGHAQLR